MTANALSECERTGVVDVKSTPRYAIMDALRGVAAIAVVLYHFGTRVGAPIVAMHGNLAVDFFFMLSGFVLAHAYERKLPNYPFGHFFKIRVIRLLPLSMLGVTLGTGYLLLRWEVYPQHSDSLLQILAASGLNLLLIPKLWIGGVTTEEVFPANGVLWSLSLEFAVNLVWAAFLFRARSSVQLALALMGAAVMAVFVYKVGEASLGWGWTTYLGGVARTVFGFFVGVVIWRNRPAVRTSWARPLVVSALLILAFVIPIRSWIYDLAVIGLVLPMLIYFSASADFVVETLPIRILSDISYPLYAVHLPLLMVTSAVLKSFLSRGQSPSAFVYGLAPLILIFAWSVGRWYDVPVRRWLTQKLNSPSAAS